MKYITAAILSILPMSCVTSGDLQRVADAVRTLETDGVRTEKDIIAVASEIDSVAKEVKERTDNFVGEMGDLGIGGLGGILALLTGVGVNMARDRARRQRGEATGSNSTTAS